MEFKLISASFEAGEAIPAIHARDGKDSSPMLQWEGVPAGTKELVLICEDPDAPQDEPWVHWLLYKIPPTVTRLPEGIPHKELLQLPPGALQGKNSWDEIGYGGPQPPAGHGWHRYYFKLYAVDRPLELHAGLSKEDILDAVGTHLTGETSLMGRFMKSREQAAV